MQTLRGLLELQWIYESDISMPLESAPQTLAGQDLPDPDILVQLQAMAEIGHLQGLRKKLEELKQDANTSEAFVRYLEAAIRQVRMENILKLHQVKSA